MKSKNSYRATWAQESLEVAGDLEGCFGAPLTSVTGALQTEAVPETEIGTVESSGWAEVSVQEGVACCSCDSVKDLADASLTTGFDESEEPEATPLAVATSVRET